MSADIPMRLSSLPGIAAVDQMRNYEISYQGMPATLGSIDANIAGRYQTRSFLSGATARSVFRQLLGTNAVIVSEPFANKHHVRAGDALTLPLAGIQASFRVIDVYYENTTSQSDVSSIRAFYFTILTATGAGALMGSAPTTGSPPTDLM